MEQHCGSQHTLLLTLIRMVHEVVIRAIIRPNPPWADLGDVDREFAQTLSDRPNTDRWEPERFDTRSHTSR